MLEDAPLGNGLVTGVAPHLHLVARLRAQEIIFCIRHLHKASAIVFVLMAAQPPLAFERLEPVWAPDRHGQAKGLQGGEPWGKCLSSGSIYA